MLASLGLEAVFTVFCPPSSAKARLWYQCLCHPQWRFLKTCYRMRDQEINVILAMALEQCKVLLCLPSARHVFSYVVFGARLGFPYSVKHIDNWANDASPSDCWLYACRRDVSPGVLQSWCAEKRFVSGTSRAFIPSSMTIPPNRFMLETNPALPSTRQCWIHQI
jgi:hypothetical protein